jgi:5'-methylthioadenosine phosphorylase
MDVPRATGQRLGVVWGHSLPEGVTLEAPDVVVVARHGPDRAVPAHLVDHGANVRTLCEQGCGRVLGLGSAGSLRNDWPVGTIVCPDDFFAPGIAPSFFEDVRGHSIPGFDENWRRRVVEDWSAVAGSPLVDGGVYAQVIGPRFETPAEVRALARDADLVGMTVASEAILAREAGLVYAAVCTIDNMANGLEPEPLTVERYREGRDRTGTRLLAALARVLPTLAGAKQ